MKSWTIPYSVSTLTLCDNASATLHSTVVGRTSANLLVLPDGRFYWMHAHFKLQPTD